MSIKKNDSDKAKHDDLLSEGYGPTVILFAGILFTLFVTSFF